MTRITVDLAFTPALVDASRARPVVIMIDVLRATSTIATLFQLEARSVSLAGSLRQARALAREGRPVCAEVGSGAQVQGCSLPVSPSRLTRDEVAGRDVVFRTTNGTRALRRAARRSEHVLVGSLLNASAVAQRALGLALAGDRYVVVACAGRWYARIPCLDDTYAAGFIVQRICDAAGPAGHEIRLTDAAKIGLALRESSGPPELALAQSATATVLRRLDCEDDVGFCARPDATPVVPVVIQDGRVERYPVKLL